MKRYVTARMLCAQVDTQANAVNVNEVYSKTPRLHAVYSDDPSNPNYSYSQATPSASLSMTITNPAAYEAFTEGAEYDVIIVPKGTAVTVHMNDDDDDLTNHNPPQANDPDAVNNESLANASAANPGTTVTTPQVEPEADQPADATNAADDGQPADATNAADDGQPADATAATQVPETDKQAQGGDKPESFPS